jgi:hypothetical protein
MTAHSSFSGEHQTQVLGLIASAPSIYEVAANATNDGLGRDRVIALQKGLL